VSPNPVLTALILIKAAGSPTQSRHSLRRDVVTTTSALLNSCTLVDGEISPKGWFKFWVKKAG